MTQRRILLASYHFPPDAAVGALRPAKFARTLSELGWEPHVLTIQDHLREQGLDYDRLKGLEHLHVVRTAELPRLVEAAMRVASALAGRSDGSDAARPASVGTPDKDNHGSEPLRRKLTRYVASLLLFLPDDKKNWALYASVPAVRLIRKHDIDWIYTSGPPFSVHFIGLAARRFTRARWVADFRDPWIDMLPDRFPEMRSRLSDRIEHWMESMVIRTADRVVTTTERMREAMASRYPRVPADRFVCIPNSIDIERLQGAGEPQRDPILTITYAGTLYFDRTPEPLFQAIDLLLKSGRASPRDIRVKLVGNCQYINGVPTASVVRRYGLEEVVQVIPPLPYSEAVEIMRRSHLLLVLAPDRHRLVVPAKIYDYLGSGSSVLGLAEAGATADLIADTRCGACFSHTDVDGLADYLANLLRDRAFSRLGNDPASFSRYHVKNLTERLVAEMAEADAVLLSRAVART